MRNYEINPESIPPDLEPMKILHFIIVNAWNGQDTFHKNQTVSQITNYEGLLSPPTYKGITMFIKLRENSGDVLAVNLNAGHTIHIEQISSKFTLRLTTDETIINIEHYDTHERAVQAFQNMMDKLENGHRVCDVHEL